jgi:hypothetical protein
MRRRRKLRPLNWDGREGMEIFGVWYTPEMLHRYMAGRMADFDALPKREREIVRQTGWMFYQLNAKGRR